MLARNILGRQSYGRLLNGCLVGPQVFGLVATETDLKWVAGFAIFSVVVEEAELLSPSEMRARVYQNNTVGSIAQYLANLHSQAVAIRRPINWLE